jgi:dTDP-4-dehydrorhamnose reductase
MKRFLVTGASGLLGLNMGLQIGESVEMIGQVNQHRLHNVPFKQIEIDLSDVKKTEEMMDEVRPEVLIHCAALANLDACESNQELAQRINGELPGQLAAICRKKGTYMVHISTDAVFDGTKGPYSEDDVPNPINQYAVTKLAGENEVLKHNEFASILRVNFFGWSISGKRSLAEFFANSFKNGIQVNGFTDVNFCPMMVNDLVDVILSVVDKRLKGVYHTVGRDALSKYDFGLKITQKFGYDESLIQPKSWRDGNLTAVRSPDLRLDTKKLAYALGEPLPGVDQGLERFYTQALENYPEKMMDYRIS